MQTIKVTDFMVPLAGYASVSQEATLFEAVMALEEAQKKYDQKSYRHRAVLVYDENKKIVGKLSMLDVIKALEPKYAGMGDMKTLGRWGVSTEFIKSMIKHYELWEKPLDHICKKAGELKVKEVMYTPTEGEFVSKDANLNEGIHQLIVGHHQSLLVTDKDQIIGVLRLTDVFKYVCERMKACNIPGAGQ
jgi:CBS domain-containing protein